MFESYVLMLFLEHMGSLECSLCWAPSGDSWGGLQDLGLPLTKSNHSATHKSFIIFLGQLVILKLAPPAWTLGVIFLLPTAHKFSGLIRCH